ncbi:MAG: preprotein translocase subunit SecG [Clostridium sp. SCN 57-10]|nr:MAG: preprotein translocase subunit SecG [Clostridium sp. SCN 57-10]
MVETILTVIQLIVCLVLTLSVLFQSGKQAGLSGAIDGIADTFFGKNKARSIDAKLAKVTSATAIIFIVLTFVLTLI